MQRPQRTMIKSTKIFPYNSFRKMLAPEHFLQELENCITEEIARHPRTFVNSSLHPGTLPSIHHNAQEMLVSSEKNINCVSIKVIGEGHLHQSLDVQAKQTDSVKNVQTQQRNNNHNSNSLNSRKQNNGLGFKTATLRHQNTISYTNGIASRRNISSNTSISNSVVNGTSFKIKNFGTIRENIIETKYKNNVNSNSISRKTFLKPLSWNKNYCTKQNQVKNIQSQIRIDKMYFQQNPVIMDIHRICQKLAVHRIPHQQQILNSNTINSSTSISYDAHHFITNDHMNQRAHLSLSLSHCPEYYFIISQSIFYGSLLQQTNILKLSSLCQTIHKLHARSQRGKIRIYIRLYEQNEQFVHKLINRVAQKGILMDVFIKAVNKCIQSFNVYDINAVHVHHDNTNIAHNICRYYTIIQDTHQATHNLYYNPQSATHNNNIVQKWLYIKTRGYPNTIKLLQNSILSQSHSKMCLHAQFEPGNTQSQYHNQTNSMKRWEYVKQKIQVAKFIVFRTGVSQREIKENKSRGDRHTKDTIKEKSTNKKQFRQCRDSKNKSKIRNKSRSSSSDNSNSNKNSDKKNNNKNKSKANSNQRNTFSPNKSLRNSKKQSKQQIKPQQKQNKYGKLKQRILKHIKNAIKQRRPSSKQQKQKCNKDRKCSTSQQKSKKLKIQTKGSAFKQSSLKQLNDEALAYQINELLKNNMAIFKQINKYYDKSYQELKQYDNHLKHNIHNKDNCKEQIGSSISSSSSSQQQVQNQYQQQNQHKRTQSFTID